MAKKDRDGAGSSEDGARSRRSVEFRADLGTEDAAAYLEALAGALRDGRLVIQAASDSLDVPVASHVRLDVAAKSSRNARRSSVELRLNWPKRSVAPDQSISSAGTSAAGTDDAADDRDDSETLAANETTAPADAGADAPDVEEAESMSSMSSETEAPDRE